MSFLIVLAAAAAGWAFGAAYYMALAKPWTQAANIPTDAQGRPVGESPLPYIISVICMIIVAGMMRHMFAMSEIDTLGKGVMSGLGVGAFFIAPWVVLNTAYGMRPLKLAAIDGGYAVCACTIMGAVLTAF